LTQTDLDPNYDNSFVKIKAAYLDGSGIGPVGRDLVMYRRKSYEEQHLFFKQQIIANGKLGWFLGPTGTGKSVTSFSYVSSLDRNEWKVIWVHLNRNSNYASVVIFDGDNKYAMCCTTMTVSSALFEGMLNQPSTKKAFLIIDGYVQEDHRQVLGQAMVWRREDLFQRRLAVISSMSSRGNVNYDDDKFQNLQEFTLDSWTLEENLKAVRCDEFFQSVKFALDAIDDAEEPSPEEMVAEKFLIAGGSARYMFGMCTSDVKKSILDAISSLEYEPSADILSAGHRSGKAMNRLFNQYRNPAGRPVSTFVSIFAETEIAFSRGPQAVKKLFYLIREVTSGSTTGGLFEATFFMRMRSGGVSLRCRNGTQVTFEAAKFEDYDENMEAISYPGRQLWLRPVVDSGGESNRI
jgi:hypothetical protein